MDSQVQSLEQLAELITSDVAKRLKLDSKTSADSAIKIISGDLRKFVDSNESFTQNVEKLEENIDSLNKETGDSVDSLQKEVSKLSNTIIGVVAGVDKLNNALKSTIAPLSNGNILNKSLIEEIDGLAETITASSLKEADAPSGIEEVTVDSISTDIKPSLSDSVSNSASIQPKISAEQPIISDKEQSNGLPNSENTASLYEELVQEIKLLSKSIDELASAATNEKVSAPVSNETPSAITTKEVAPVSNETPSAITTKEVAPVSNETPSAVKAESTSKKEINDSKEKSTNLIDSILGKLKQIVASSAQQQPASSSQVGPKSELIVSEKPKEVILVGLNEQVLKQLDLPAFLDKFDGLSHTLKEMNVGISGITKELKKLEEDKEGGGIFSFFVDAIKPILPILGGATLILAGVGSLVAAFNTNSGAKGALELIGKAGVRGGLTVIAKKIAETASKKVLKSIPIIGSLISFGFAIQRFNNGDTIGGVLEIGSGIASLFPGVGTVISIGIDVLQAILDAKAGGSSAEASNKKGNLLLDWAKSIGKFVDEKIKYVPVLGPLYETGRALLKGDWKKALLEFITVIPTLQVVKLFMGEEKFNAAAEDMAFSIGGWLKQIGNYIDERIKYIPILGPLYYTGKALLKGDFKRAFFEFTTLLPNRQFIRALMSEEEIQQASEGTAVSFTSWLKNVEDWIYEKTQDLPIIGPLAQAIAEIADDPISFVEALPGGKSLISFFKFATSGKVIETTLQTGKNIFQGVVDWVHEAIGELPIIGPLIKGLKSAIADPVEFLKTIPGGNLIISLFEGAKNLTSSALNAVGNIASSMADKLKKFFDSIMDSIMNSILNLIPETSSIGGISINVRSRVANLLGIKSKTPEVEKQASALPSSSSSALPPSLSPTSMPSKSSVMSKSAQGMDIIPPQGEVEQLQDGAINPDGGLIISSPKIGSLYQINKQDGIVSGPAVSTKINSQTNGFAKMESLLEKIVGNTFVTNQNMSNLITGFNKMARALQDKIGEDLAVPIISNQMSQQSSAPSFTQYANVGNPEIANFRVNIVESSRFQPA